jgi:hypothetical protein
MDYFSTVSGNDPSDDFVIKKLLVQWTCGKNFLSKDDILRRRLLVIMFAEGVPQAPVFFVCCKSCYILVSFV